MKAQENNDLIGWMRKNERTTLAAHNLVKFFDWVGQMAMWNFEI